jgi:hypothetical protein
MITQSTYITVTLMHHEGGTYWAKVTENDHDDVGRTPLMTMYSESSSLFEEVASLVDAMLWSWVALTDPTMTDAATG